MVIDTSAIIAVLLNEANALGIAQAIKIRLPAPSIGGESSGSIDGHREPKRRGGGGRELDLPLYRAAIEVVAVDQDQVEIAQLAWRQFGRGRHPAGLNYGDCFAYALAKARRLPLLFQGDDFTRTDIAGVPPQTPLESEAI